MSNIEEFLREVHNEYGDDGWDKIVGFFGEELADLLDKSISEFYKLKSSNTIAILDYYKNTVHILNYPDNTNDDSIGEYLFDELDYSPDQIYYMTGFNKLNIKL